MAETEQLVVALEARIRDFERNFLKASRTASQSFDGIERRSRQATGRIESHMAGLGRSVAAGFAGAVSIRASQQLIDASIRVSNSLKVAGLSGDDLKQVYDSLFASAQRNAAPLESLAQLYSRVSLVQNELGASTKDMLGFTDNVALALRVAGTDATSASGALLQLSQAMGSGTVRAEEFNSILEGALPIAQATAAGLTEAGGSVSKLRQLVVDGKVSSQAFFDAFQAGSVMLETQVASSETTVSSSFVRLQNVLIDAAGRFNETSNAGQRFAGFLDTLGGKITAFVNSPGFDGALNDLGDAMAQTFAKDAQDIQRVIGLVEALASKFDRYGASVSDAELELAQAEQAVVNLAQNTKGQFGEVDAAFQDLVQQLLEGRGTAETAADAISALGDANPNFSSLQANISSVIQSFIALRDAASAAHAAAANTDAIGTAPTLAEFNKTFAPAPVVKPVTLADYTVPSSGGGGGGGGRSGGGGGGASADSAQSTITELQDELRALGQSEVAKRIDAELRKAGASATDDQKASIRELVSQIDTETAAMEKLEEASEAASGIAKEFITGIVGDLRSGVDGATALANAFSRLADKLLDMALNSLIDDLFANLFKSGGGGILGGLFKFNGGGPVKAATGGHIRGPGTATSDSIPAMLSNGEFVVRASQTRKYGPLLEAINSGRIQAFADGGKVGGGGLAGIVTQRPSINVGDINITTQSTGDAAMDEQNGKMTAKAIDQMLEKKIAKWATNQSRPGGMITRR